MKSTAHAKTLLLNHNFFPPYFANFSVLKIFYVCAESIDSIMLSPFLNVLHSLFFSFFLTQIVMNFLKLIISLQIPSVFHPILLHCIYQ